MKSPLPTGRLPERPDLEQLKRQARELLDAFVAGEHDAVAEVNRFYRAANGTSFAQEAHHRPSFPAVGLIAVNSGVIHQSIACSGHVQRRPSVVRLAVHHARVRVEDDDRITFNWGMPLYQCARYGKHAMAEMLLERGADPNGQVYASGTPLSEAYGQRDEKMVALLERYGGRTNASMAGLYRRADIARRLLDQFGDADLPDDGFSKGPVAEQFLGAAARGGDPEILRMALEHVNIPHGDSRWNGLLQGPLEFWNHWMGRWCHPEWDRSTYLTCFKMILERCGPPNAPLHGGVTILHQIVVMGDHVRPEERVAFATAALDAGARMDLRDDLLKSTALGWACRWGREELVRLFLQRGADPLERDAESWATPLAWAEKKGRHVIATILRQHRES